MHFNKLKLLDNGIPTIESLKYPLLQVVKKYPLELEDTILDKLQDELTPDLNLIEVKKRLLRREARNLFHELVKSGLIIEAQNGEYKLSNKGKDYLKSTTFENKNIKPENDSTKKVIKQSTKNYSEREIKDWFIYQKNLLKKNLLEKMYNVDPYHFEHMMLQLLNSMGYKGTNGESLVTQKSNDNGIDGIINQDPLGMQNLYVQVKRYGKNNKVQRPEIDGFGGALRRQGIDRGVFITTSSFTQGAKEAAKPLHISLVDGEMLTNLMIQYQVGVEPKDTQTLYQIDNDFFISDKDK